MLSLHYDGEESSDLRLTFSGEGTGSYSFRCEGSSRGQGSIRMSELENRVPRDHKHRSVRGRGENDERGTVGGGR